MEFHQHPACNAVLAPPKGATPDECSALPIMRAREGDVPCVVSFWRPSGEELQALNLGASVAVVLQGWTHAPLRVVVAE